MALLHLAQSWARTRNIAAPAVLTVDHGLSAGSRSIAASVAAAAAGLGLSCVILPWTSPKPSANLEAAARVARYRLMGAWCAAHRVAGLYLAHTLEDQAETFLLRLARGSGLDGLAGMRALAPYPMPGFTAVRLVRPLLGIERAALRSHLTAKAIGWHEDPMNADPRFDRVRLRQAWPALEAIGLAPARIAAAAGHLARARSALDGETNAFLAEQTQNTGSAIRIDTAALAARPREIGLRVLAAALMEIGGNVYRPRFERLEDLYNAVVSTNLVKARTLAGCRIAPHDDGKIIVTREVRRSRGKEAQAGGVTNPPHMRETIRSGPDGVN